MRALVLAIVVAAACREPIKLLAQGDSQTLRQHAGRPNAPETAPVLVLALDGVNRGLLYGLLQTGNMPNLAALLGPEAYYDDTFLTVMPSSTMAAWASAFTGLPPAAHGVAGNEFFIRETRTFACPAPVSFEDIGPTLQIYTDGYLNKLVDAPTVYERIHARDPDALIWVAMAHVFRGADRLLLAKRSALIAGLDGFLEALVMKYASRTETRRLYAMLDEAAVDVVVDKLGSGPVPDVLTVYLSGTDLYAHVAEEGPDEARRAYLVEVVDPALGKLAAALRERDALAHRWVIVTADHGHTQVLHDGQHALDHGLDGPDEVLRRAGFLPRPAKHTVPDDLAYDSVTALGGGTAYVYLADRSQCSGHGCAWQNPPRYREDVLAAADALWRANLDGPVMRNTLDLILVRHPRPYADIDEPFVVYAGNGKTVPIDDYLAAHRHPTYIAVAQRLRDLGVGVHGERAGDILLIPHFSDGRELADRYYFAGPYRSWHGSPSRADSEIPLIVANPDATKPDVKQRVRGVLGDRPYLYKLTDLILSVRGPSPR